MARVTVTFTLDSEKDARLVRWLNQAGNRSAAIREALNAYLGGAGVTLGDVYQAVKDLEHKIGAASFAVISEPGRREEPPDVAATLDRLGL